jgi:signal transduction histidine kinase/ActR/RegA family two-component response regulator
MTLSDLVLPEQRTFVHEIMSRLQAGIAAATFDLTIVDKSGRQVMLEVRAQPRFRDGQPVGVQGIARDVTERKRLEAQLRQSQKMEALGTLAGGVAHDFNNILSAILGYTELTLSDITPDRKGRDYLRQVLVAGERAKELVQQLLAFSRQTEQERRPVLLYLIVKEVLMLLRAALPATITLRERLDNTPGYIMADPTQIHQVLLNLCTNASQAMQTTGGDLMVSLDMLDVTADMEAVSPHLRPGSYMRLSVEDTGNGIPVEFLERIFEPFFTTKSIGQGTGLGLAVVHGIVSSHGGAIMVKSTPGQGTIFEVYLPRSNQTTRATVSATTEEDIPTGTECVLFVDDEEALAHLGQLSLQRLGYRVVLHTDSIAALEAFRAAPDDFDLLITDQTMPRMTGDALVQAVHHIRPDLPVILCTGFSHTMTAERAAVLGINAFCMKPSTIRDLAVVIRQVLTSPGDTQRTQEEI